MAYERGETSKRRESHIYFQGSKGKDDFLDLLNRKYGSVIRAWRVALDTDDSGLLDAREFAKAMGIIGFVGNARSLWFNLDDDQSGYISLAELDPVAALVLEKFRAQCTLHFGSVDAAWEQCLDKDHSGALTLPELEVAASELGYTSVEEVHNLFNLLRLEPAAFRIMKHEVTFLQRWEERKQKTLSRAWRVGARWVNKDPYFHKDPANLPDSWKPKNKVGSSKTSNPTESAAKYLPRFSTPSPVPPSDSPLPWMVALPPERPQSQASESKVDTHPVRVVSPCTASVISDDDDGASSEISNYTDIVAIDKQKAWSDFTSYLIREFGSLVHAFDVMDTSGDGSIEREEWMDMVTRRLRYCRASEALRLFDSKIASKSGRITYEVLGITRQEWIIYNHDKKQQEQKMVNRSVQMKPSAFGGHGMRRTLADQDHEKRMKCKPKKPPEAFWTALPSGWGFPPSYINFKAAKAERRRRSGHFGPLSARGSVAPDFTELSFQNLPVSAR